MENEGLRLCHSLLLAAGALAKMVKLAALRLFVLFCTSPLQEQAPPSPGFRSLRSDIPPRLRRGFAKQIKKQRSSKLDADFPFALRRGRDSNPRNVSVQRFSRPPQSTTLPPLQSLQKHCCVSFGIAKVDNFFYSATFIC